VEADPSKHQAQKLDQSCLVLISPSLMKQVIEVIERKSHLLDSLQPRHGSRCQLQRRISLRRHGSKSMFKSVKCLWGIDHNDSTYRRTWGNVEFDDAMMLPDAMQLKQKDIQVPAGIRRGYWH